MGMCGNKPKKEFEINNNFPINYPSSFFYKNDGENKTKTIQRKYRCHLAENKLKTLFNDKKNEIILELDKKKLVNCSKIDESESEKSYQKLLKEGKIKPFEERLKNDNNIKKQLNSLEKFTIKIPEYVVSATNVVYKGSWNTKKKFHGHGIMFEFNYIKNKDCRKEGIFKDGYLCGFGQMFLSNGEFVLGFFAFNALNGYGEYYRKDGSVYMGQFYNGLPQGNGKEIFKDKSSFEGFYLAGKKKYGKFTWVDGNFYQGDFEKDLFNGWGVYTWGNERKYEGNWKDGKMNGKGKLTYRDGSYYDGDFINNKKHGKGKYVWLKNKYFDGEWKENKQNGFGIYVKNGRKVKGFWKNGQIIKNEYLNSEKDINPFSRCLNNSGIEKKKNDISYIENKVMRNIETPKNDTVVCKTLTNNNIFGRNNDSIYSESSCKTIKNNQNEEINVVESDQNIIEIKTEK